MKALMTSAALAAVLTLSACGGGDTQTTTTTTENLSADNAIVTDPAALNATGMDANATMDGNMAMGGNMAMDANTQAAMANDMNTNDPDTNLANGM